MLALAFACLAVSLGVAQPPTLVGLNVVSAAARIPGRPGLLLPGDEFVIRFNSTGAFLRVFNSWNVAIDVFVNGSQIAHQLLPNATSPYCVDACVRGRINNHLEIFDSTSHDTLYDGHFDTPIINWQARFWDWNKGRLQEVESQYLARLENPNFFSHVDLGLVISGGPSDSTYLIPESFRPVVDTLWTLQVRRSPRGIDDWESASPLNSLVKPFQLFPYLLTVTGPHDQDMHVDDVLVATGLFREGAFYRCTFLPTLGYLFASQPKRARSTTRFECPPIDFIPTKDRDMLYFGIEEGSEEADAPIITAWHKVYDVTRGGGSRMFYFRSPSPSPSRPSLSISVSAADVPAIAIGAGATVGLGVLVLVVVLVVRQCRKKVDGGYATMPLLAV